MAGFGYFRTNKTHTTSIEELANQNRVVETLLKEKGFPAQLIDLCKDNSLPKGSWEKNKFRGVTVYDSVNYMLCYLPAKIPGEKLEQFIFKIKIEFPVKHK